MLKVNNISKTYSTKNKSKEILRDVSFEFEYGKMYSIYGESGSGKTTFLAILGGLHKPDSGTIILDGKTIDKSDLSEYRKNNIGFVFQDFNLIPYMNGIQNVMTALSITTGTASAEVALDLLETVGIKPDVAQQRISTLSGGEKQRVAIARALAGDKKIILADEPTGNLDKNTTLEIVNLFHDLANHHGKCIIIVTHLELIGEYSNLKLHLNQDSKQFEVVAGTL